MGLERLQIAFYLANVTGLLPFRLTLDGVTKSFRDLQFRWNQAGFLWFTLLLAGELIYGPSTMAFHFHARSVMMHSGDMPMAHVATLGLWEISYWIVKCCPRLLLFHYARLKKILSTLDYVDQALRLNTDPVPCRTTRRSIVGIIVGVFCVSLDGLLQDSVIPYLYDTMLFFTDNCY